MKFFNKTTLMASSIVVLLSMNSVLIMKLNHFEDRMNTSINNISGLSAQISHLQTELYQVNKGEKVISSESYDIQSSEDYNTASVKVNVSLNKYKTGSKVLFLYRDRDSDNEQWVVEDLKKQDGLNFNREIELSYDKNYVTQLIIQDSDEQQSEKMSPINLKDELRQRLHLEAGPKTADSRGNLTFSATVRNNYYMGESLKLESARLNIYFEDKLVHTVDMMKKGEKHNWRQEPIEEWNYTESIVIESMKYSKDRDFMKLLNIELIVKDKLGKEYEYKYGEY